MRYIKIHFLKKSTTDKIRINHYPVKSYEEFLIKAKKGNAAYGYSEKSMAYFTQYDLNDVYDPILLKYVPDLKKKL